MPKPGQWMVTFKRWMALPMALTALALLWLGYRIGGTVFFGAVLALTVLLVVGLFHVGRIQRRGASAFLPALAVAIVPLATALQLGQFAEPPSASAEQGVLPAQPFSEAALASARASGKPVFAYFTADWCLTCKVNEAAAIEREETRAAFAKAGVVVLRGDWTRRDAAITRYLTAQGAAGVPLYVWYPAGSEPRQLPQVLTAASLAELAAN
jgi:thiol:disulfide interchange protein